MKGAGAGAEVRSVSTSKYNLVQLLGRGAFSEVYAARTSSTVPFTYAVKICTIENDKDEDAKDGGETQTLQKTNGSLQRESSTDSSKVRAMPFYACLSEIRILREVQTKSDRYVVQLFDCFQVENSVWIVMELLETNLRELLALQKSEREAATPVCEAAVYIHEVLLALKHLKQHRVIHRDIKPENIVVSNLGRVKLIDFGISSVVPLGQDHCIVTTRLGTKQYMASELFLKGAPYDYTVDLWALGLTLFNICNRGKNAYTSNGWFDNGCWRTYAMSFGRYLNSAFGFNIITPELLEYDLFKQGVSDLRDFRKIIQKCVVPLPIGGPLDIPVERAVDEKRVTWEEFYEWSKTYVGEMQEFSKRQIIMRNVRLVKILRARRKKRVEEGIDEREETDSSSTSTDTLVPLL